MTLPAALFYDNNPINSSIISAGVIASFARDIHIFASQIITHIPYYSYRIIIENIFSFHEDVSHVVGRHTDTAGGVQHRTGDGGGRPTGVLATPDKEWGWGTRRNKFTDNDGLTCGNGRADDVREIIPIVIHSVVGAFAVRNAQLFRRAGIACARYTRARFVRLIYAFVAYTRRPGWKKIYRRTRDGGGNFVPNKHICRIRRGPDPKTTENFSDFCTRSTRGGGGVEKNNTYICTRVVRVSVMLYDRTCAAGGYRVESGEFA